MGRTDTTRLWSGTILILLTFGCGPNIKIRTETFEDGSTKEEYQYYHNPDTNRRIKDGWYNSYYPSGEYREVGMYTDDQRDGEWTYFDDDGTELKGVYRDGTKWSGVFSINVRGRWGRVHYHLVETTDSITEIGVTKGVFSYENGQWHGIGVRFWTNGRRSEGDYREGRREGRHRLFSESGRLERESTYLDGMLDGTETSYYPDGTVRLEMNFTRGQEDGKSVWYHESGEIARVTQTETEESGRKISQEVLYYRSGEVKARVGEIDDRYEGKRVFYDKEGTVTDEDIYRDDECIEMCEGDE
jgi:uncharacterized protein